MVFLWWKGYICFMRLLVGEKNFFVLNNNNWVMWVYLRLSLYKEREMNCVLDSDVEDLGNEWFFMYDINVYMKLMFVVN